MEFPALAEEAPLKIEDRRSLILRVVAYGRVAITTSDRCQDGIIQTFPRWLCRTVKPDDKVEQERRIGRFSRERGRARSDYG